MIVNGTPYYIGTSGYKYDDWKDVFYPTLAHNYEMLEHYSRKMNFLEITFTFYKIPLKRTIASLLDRVGDDFKFSVRLTKEFLKNKYTEQDVIAFNEGISPLLEAGSLAAIYADFNYGFSAKKAHFEHLCNLKSHFSYVPFFVELPNRTWYKERYVEDFKANNIGVIINDTPEIKGLAPYFPVNTNLNTYFRLHGKNKLWLTPEDRINEYNYSIIEMRKFKADAARLSILSNSVFISFCNVPQAHAPRNAEQFIKMLERDLKK